MNQQIEWKENINPELWDEALSSMHGHPLQSAYWGDAKKVTSGINDIRFSAARDGKIIFLARCEERKFLKLIKLAWIPRGPVISDEEYRERLMSEFFSLLRKRGFLFCIINPWKKVFSSSIKKSFTKTIWIDLTSGRDKLWSEVSKHFRSDVRRSHKMGIAIEQSNKEEDIVYFYNICKQVSTEKKFSLYGSKAFMKKLIKIKLSGPTKSVLFLAKKEEKICGGAFITCCGKNVHYMWAGVDRDYFKFNIGEALQWAIIEWALVEKYERYDLEGIDPKKNPGTYHFKRKLGGEVITIPGRKLCLLKMKINAIKGIRAY